MLWGALVTLLLAGLVFCLLPAPPSHLKPNSSRGEPCQTPGPVLAALTQQVSLDGLTIIPVVHLPPIKFSLSLPFLERKLHVRLALSASEVVFKTLRLGSASFRALDAGRAPGDVLVERVDSAFSGSFSLKLTVQLGKHGKAWRLGGVGRISEARLRDSKLRLKLQLVQALREGAAPRFQVLSSAVEEGTIEEARIEGFGVWGGVVTKLLPFIKGTWLVRWPTTLAGDYFVREIVEGSLMDALLSEIFATAQGHIDISSYGALVDSERAHEVATPLDASSLVPPSPSLGSSSSHPQPSSPQSDVMAPPASATATPFRVHAHLIGPTLLTSFPLPDFSPQLYPPGGTRAKLQSFNLLTSELRLSLSRSSFSLLSFERGSIAFDPPTSGTGLGGGELVVTVQELQVVLESAFKIHADTSGVVAFATGLKRVGEKGTSRTVVEARSLQLRFLLVPSPTRDEGAAYSLHTSSITPFTTITPSFELDNSALRLGAEAVNLVTRGLKTQIAQASSFVVQRFVKDRVRRYLQGVMDGVEEKLREAGVELPSELRAGGRG